MPRPMIAQSVGAFPLLIRGALARWLSATCLLSGRRHLPNSCQPMNRLVPRTITGWRSLANKLRLPSRLGEMQAATSEGRHWCLLVWSGRTFSGLPVPDSHPTRFTSRATRALRRGNHSDTLLKPQILRVTPFGITGITVTLYLIPNFGRGAVWAALDSRLRGNDDSGECGTDILSRLRRALRSNRAHS